jgi:predicted ester cyclase
VTAGSIEIFTTKDGKIVEERQEADMLGMMTQLGLELKPTEPEK